MLRWYGSFLLGGVWKNASSGLGPGPFVEYAVETTQITPYMRTYRQRVSEI